MPRRIPAAVAPAQLFWRNPRLPFLEGRCSRGVSACYRPHTHPTLSVGIVDEGTSRAVIADRAILHRAGDVMLIGPDVVHACNPRNVARWSYRMFQFDWDWVCNVAPRAVEIFAERGAHQPLRSVAARRALDVITAAASNADRVADAETLVVRALRELLRRLRPAAPKRATPGTNRAALATARLILSRECHRKQSVRALARDLGVNPYGLIRGFRAQVGLTPHAYQLDQQVTRAKALLARGESIAEVAHALGFADQSHFQRAFKSRTAATPAQYRAARTARWKTSADVTPRVAGMVAGR